MPHGPTTTPEMTAHVTQPVDHTHSTIPGQTEQKEQTTTSQENTERRKTEPNTDTEHEERSHDTRPRAEENEV